MVPQKKIGLDRDDYEIEKFYQELAVAICRSGQYAGLLLIASGFDTTLCFDFILNVLAAGYLHHNQIFGVMIEKGDYDINNLIMMRKGSGLLVF